MVVDKMRMLNGVIQRNRRFLGAELLLRKGGRLYDCRVTAGESSYEAGKEVPRDSRVAI